MAGPIEACDNFVEEPEEMAPIAVVAIYRLSNHPTTRHVIDASRKLGAKRTGHATTLGRRCVPSGLHRESRHEGATLS
jgi:hypothetical protein